MLDTIREHSRSTIIYVLFGIIIIVFVFTFNTGGTGKDCGSTGAVSMATVNGEAIDSAELNMGMALTPDEPNPLGMDENAMRRTYIYNHTRFLQLHGAQSPYFLYMADASEISPIKIERVVDDLVETHLVSDAARSLGLAATDEELRDRLYAKEWYDEKGRFRKEDFQNYVSFALRTSLVQYESFIEREILREKVIDLITAGVVPDPAEIAYYADLQGAKVNLEFVEIDPAWFASEVRVDAAAIDAALASRGEELKAHLEQNRAAFAKKTWLFRGLRLAPTAEAPDALVAAQALHAELAAMGDAAAREARLTELATQLSTHEGSKANGGLMGDYLDEAALAQEPFGEALAGALAAAADGDLLAPVAVSGAVWLVQRVGERAGALPEFDGIARQVAEHLLREEGAPGAAKALIDRAEAWIAAHPAASMAELVDFLAAARPAGYTVQETGTFARMPEYSLGQSATLAGSVPKVGRAPDLVALAFSLTPEQPLAKRIVRVEGSGRFVAVRLKERVAAEGEEATKAATELRDILGRMAKRNAYLAWYRALKDRALAKGDLVYTDDFQRLLDAEKARFEEVMKRELDKHGAAIKLMPQAAGAEAAE